MDTYIQQQECLKCGHKWLPRSPKKPARCPWCNCQEWWLKRPARCYNFDLEEGEKRFFSAVEIWRKDNAGNLTNNQFNKEYHYARRRNKFLRRVGGNGGVWVWNTKNPGLDG